MEPRFPRGAALRAQGRFEEAVACLRDALAGALGARTFRLYGFTRLAEAMVSRDALLKIGWRGSSCCCYRHAYRR
jgi:hypothetical protein